ncbi:chemotaxis protein CheD [Hydrogenoanaerobacterium saccharovorans]|uniref:Probable chemoreceptor glutamine deamidase CheD n=1 Tax=Hydrogenoanaerobacterium saccharovorans TaxID=474960 RepID=A0A1H7ZUC8_9FIRM|nr:chemotaxis protein CheD [Hydrogenoanaerobacterium saccharovorans]RPF48411.1 chemotaxis protein CheD [Hydrogenoanaerobacterium saccharovorans]SEM61394.1 chemotaxis protein CheD [Hydrogenoanaerobacterium saccharovorans]
MSKIVTVGISDINLVSAPDVLVTYALGSCVGICLLDPLSRLGGLAHIMLPSSKQLPNIPPSNKFADTAILNLVKQMESLGARKARLKAKIAGGACMFNCVNNTAISNIGKRNVAEVKNILATLGIPILAEDTGSDYGRTLYFYPENGTMKIKSALKGESFY